MSPKELEFHRIARQAREFREQEEKRIAAEKEKEMRRIAATKEAELEQIAQAHEESLEKQHERLEAEENDGVLAPSSSFDSKSSQPSPGTVKRRAEWLRNLEKDAVARRVLEEKFNALLEARRKNNPNEAVTESEAAVRAVLWSSSDDSQRSHSLHSVVEEDTESRIAERLQYAESKMDRYFDKEMKNVKAKAVEAEESQIEHDTSTNKKSNVEVEVIDHIPQIYSMEEKTVKSTYSHVVESETTTTIQEKPNTQCSPIELKSSSNSDTKQRQPKQKVQQTVFEYGTEVDPRTQAMLTEDELIPNGINREDDINISLRSGIPDFAQDRNKKKLAVDGKIFRIVKGSLRNTLDNEDDPSSEIVYKEATFELPVEVAENGLILSPDTADLKMITTIPPSRLGGQVSGHLEGRSSLGNKSYTASGSASLEYKASRHSRLTLGMIRGCEPHHPLITIGGRLLRHGSSVGIIFYHNAKFLHQMMLEHSLWSLSFRHCFPHSKWCISSQLSRRQDLSLSLKNGNKLSGVIGWNLLKPMQSHARIDVHPKITEYRRAHLYCQWQALSGPGVWNFGVSLVQNLHSQIATIGLGWRLFSTRGLEWVISWSRGNATIRIPIVISKGLAANATIGHSLYFSIISYLIQDYIAEVWGWVGNVEDEDDDITANSRLLAIRSQNLTKARRDAAIQKDLMSRQARRKTKDEKERDGLIINKATYEIENGEEWDVTIPLQFWVSRSTLILTARPKSELLGFYDIAVSLENDSAISSTEDTNTGQTRSLRRQFPSWSDVWYDLLDWTPKGRLLRKATDLHSPTLSVWYEFEGRSHQITVKDREELRLPAL